MALPLLVSQVFTTSLHPYLCLADEMSYVLCLRCCWYPLRSPLPSSSHRRCWLPIAHFCPWNGDVNCELPQPEVSEKWCVVCPTRLQGPCFWAKPSIGDAVCTSKFSVGSGWDFTFPEPTSWTVFFPWAVLFLTPYRFPPIKYSHKSPISGSDFREWDQSYSFNQKLRTGVGREATQLPQSMCVANLQGLNHLGLLLNCLSWRSSNIVSIPPKLS